MPDLDETRYAFEQLLEEAELEYATDTNNDRYVIPTESGAGVVAEFVELDVGEDKWPALLDVRHDLWASDLSHNVLFPTLSALSQHSVVAERLELEFRGRPGPSYDQLIEGE